MADQSFREVKIYTLSHPITGEIRYIGKRTKARLKNKSNGQ